MARNGRGRSWPEKKPGGGVEIPIPPQPTKPTSIMSEGEEEPMEADAEPMEADAEPMEAEPVLPEAGTEPGGASAVATAVTAADREGQRLVSTQTVQHEYLTLNGQVARETITTDGVVTAVMDFIYDESGRPFALKYSDDGGKSFDTYYYVLNLQGDVVKLVWYIPGFEYEAVASYTYDAWGNILSATGELAEVNPLRYRGYYYDAETGFYYLQSRYYDPATRRFINADSYASTGQGFIGCNMYAYCLNNPVILFDTTGSAGVFVMGTGITITSLLQFAVVAVAVVMIGVGVTYLAESSTGAISVSRSQSKSKEQTATKYLADVKVKRQRRRHYQLAYINDQGELIRIGYKITFEEALEALGVTGATNDINRRYEYNKGKSSEAQRELEQLGTGYWGIYADTQYAAKALAVVFGFSGPPEVHGSGKYGHYHDSNHVFHIWFGGKVQY